MPDGHAIEGDELAVLAIDSLRNGHLAVHIVVETAVVVIRGSGIVGIEVISFKKHAIEGYILQTRGPEEAATNVVILVCPAGYEWGSCGITM